MAETLVRIEEIQGRGRALVSSRLLKGGEVVLRDSPILLYSALPFNRASIKYCDECFKQLQSAVVSCPSCSHHHFCAPTCLSTAMASSHTPWVCQSLIRLRECSSLAVDRQVLARFLIAAYNLAVVSPPNFQILLSVQGGGENEDAEVAQFLHSLILSLCPPLPIEISLELTRALLAKDKLNAFGLMEPFNLNEERSVRAYGIYPRASLFNHDCLPNACRFDYVDTATDRNTDIIIRMIHDVPEGREICLSYFPVNENYVSRQKRLLEDYGFTCVCDRCKVEANWSDHEEEEQEEGGEEAMEEDHDESMEEEEEEEGMVAVDKSNETDFPHAYFFLRYMCDQENCGGSLAPLSPSNANLLECNVCGNIKNEEAVDA